MRLGVVAGVAFTSPIGRVSLNLPCPTGRDAKDPLKHGRLNATFKAYEVRVAFNPFPVAFTLSIDPIPLNRRPRMHQEFPQMILKSVSRIIVLG